MRVSPRQTGFREDRVENHIAVLQDVAIPASVGERCLEETPSSVFIAGPHPAGFARHLLPEGEGLLCFSRRLDEGRSL
jgi:hypothetical protein